MSRSIGDNLYWGWGEKQAILILPLSVRSGKRRRDGITRRRTARELLRQPRDLQSQLVRRPLVDRLRGHSNKRTDQAGCRIHTFGSTYVPTPFANRTGASAPGTT